MISKSLVSTISDKSLPRFRGQPVFNLSKGIVASVHGFFPFIWVNRLDPDLEKATDWSMVRYLYFMTSILYLLDMVRTTV